MADFKAGYVGRLPIGDVYRCGQNGRFIKSSLAVYRKEETSKTEVTHVQVCADGSEWHFLRSYALDSWAIKVVA